jgi:hypothetical protein
LHIASNRAELRSSRTSKLAFATECALNQPDIPPPSPDQFKFRIGSMEATASGRFAIIVAAALVVVLVLGAWCLRLTL